MIITEERITKELIPELREALESVYVDGFKVVSIDLETMKLTIEFEICVVEEDDYIGWSYY